eukprot:CAMPEP_0194032888 /NCGR_PEP_ID=MMETSP0009_2-20130614/5734_1 /TAXON_ID=210454 /ORGANISM="Grammatophora oceanica, Strain CCMP 410" /LENGTH=428 /DNA_ID=CAMNT_0038673461 /DNA_START=68 /DNA_END=1355 /DNA_ORIENTATION=+
MSGIEDSVCADLFQDPQNQISVQFVELAGKLVNDLLQESQVKIADQPSGNVRLLNAKVVQVSSPEALAKAIARGKRRRSTEATDKNGVSSRSHAVCQISCVNAKKQLGILNLIDLAGSERRGDSLFHSGERQKESTEINSSLYSLKECIRARMSGKPNNVIPYRSSNLTRILRPTLETSDAQLSVIATVAPNATDSEHTIETLKTVCSLIGTLPCLEDEVEVPDAPVGRLLSPKQYSNDDIVSFMMEKKLLKEEEAKNIPDKMNGRQLMRMTIMQLKNAIYSQDADQDRAEKLFRCLRRESDRVGRLELKQRIAIRKAPLPALIDSLLVEVELGQVAVESVCGLKLVLRAYKGLWYIVIPQVSTNIVVLRPLFQRETMVLRRENDPQPLNNYFVRLGTVPLTVLAVVAASHDAALGAGRSPPSFSFES